MWFTFRRLALAVGNFQPYWMDTQLHKIRRNALNSQLDYERLCAVSLME